VRKHQFALFLIIAFIWFFSLVPIAFADLVNYDFINSTCKPGEQWISCTNYIKSTDLVTTDNCKKLELDPHYTLLTEKSSILGGERTYCYREMSSSEFFPQYLSRLYKFIGEVIAPLVFLTVILELPVFFALGLRTKKQLMSVIFVNFITVPLINVTLFLIPIGGLMMLLAGAMFAVFFESGSLVAFNKTLTLPRIFGITFGANVLSAVVGGLILSWMLS